MQYVVQQYKTSHKMADTSHCEDMFEKIEKCFPGMEADSYNLVAEFSHTLARAGVAWHQLKAQECCRVANTLLAKTSLFSGLLCYQV